MTQFEYADEPQPTGGSGLEKTRLRLGIIPLTDCAPLVVAKEMGYFAQQGLDVSLSREPSWANIRDKVVLGELDGAHMLAGMPIAATLGLAGAQKAMVTAFSMDLNGNAITVSNELYARMQKADPQAMQQRPIAATALRKVIDEDRAAGRPPMTFAMVFPVSMHNYQLRYWMASAGIDPDRDLRLVVLPPPQMVDNLASRAIVGYCVGEPWNQQAVELGIGHVVVTGYELWNNAPEKVFGVTRAWAEAHPNTHRALLRALLQAARWMDAAENRAEVVHLIARREYVHAPAEVVAHSMTGTWRYAHDEAPVKMTDFNVFHRYCANFPWRSHALWLLAQMVRWGQIDAQQDLRQIAESVYRTDIYRAAAADLGLPVPDVDYKSEGLHAGAWSIAGGGRQLEMGADRFFDGANFDPDHPGDLSRNIPVHAMHMAALHEKI
ncbi:MAG: ABC transporter substrate-binding protein [Rhodocyclaceae bacterium]|nr:ABC transporter substrate-binding protein [Rhodocyclaceae bacterium]MBX3668584.1 ABC transporter substrate-binding protein [Rhodocyclaceae bacterium]